MSAPVERRPVHVERNVLSAQVKDRILQWIVEGHLAPGSRIVETRVARDLGTSQAPVREALRDLATLGLVELKPYRGARVRQPSKRELIEAMEVRGELEAMGARQAAESITEEGLTTLRTLIEEMQDYAEIDDAHGHALKNTEFHRAIMKASGNETLVRVWSMLEPFARTYLTASVPGIDLHWLAGRHEAIFDALRAHDPDQADEAMRIHTKEAEALVMRLADAEDSPEETA